MNAQDEEDFVFACLLGAYIQSLRQHQGQSAADRKKAKQADEKANIHVGSQMVI